MAGMRSWAAHRWGPPSATTGSTPIPGSTIARISSQPELLAASKPDEAARAAIPELDVDANELALVYRARGMPVADAERRAAAVLRGGRSGTRSDNARSGHADVVGSAIGAASSSYASFSVGAAVPVLPFLFGLDGVAAVAVAAVLTGTALMLTGAIVAVLSGGPPLRRALRQLAIGAAAATATFLLGLAFEHLTTPVRGEPSQFGVAGDAFEVGQGRILVRHTPPVEHGDRPLVPDPDLQVTQFGGVAVRAELLDRPGPALHRRQYLHGVGAGKRSSAPCRPT
jgi:VIT1/CCC1 family predicted Fe2+/Mn2+ transporter